MRLKRILGLIRYIFNTELNTCCTYNYAVLNQRLKILGIQGFD